MRAEALQALHPSIGLAGLPLAAQGLISRMLGRDNPVYRARTAGPQLTLRNEAQGLVASFTSSGAVVDGSGAHVGLALRAWGYGSALSPVAAVGARASANRVAYHRGELSEWYVNGPLGIEQGFRLEREPAASTRGPLTLALALSGSQAQLTPAGDGLTFQGSPLRYRGLVAHDARGRTLRSWFELRGSQLLIRVAAARARYPVTVDPIFQAAKLTASDGATNDALGTSLAFDGETIVAGAPGATVGGHAQQGAAYVFTEPAGGWTDETEAAKLTVSGGAAHDTFGLSVAISGDSVVVGAPGAVAAYVFVKQVGGWSSTSTPTATLTPSDTAVEFGHSVAIGGNTIVVSAPGSNSQVGNAYVYVRGLAWTSGTQTAELSVASSCCEFGEHVAISGDGGTVAIGAASMISGHVFQGAVYVFLKGASWTDRTSADATLTASDGGVQDDLGVGGVAISSDAGTIVGGANQAPYDIPNNTAGPGKAYIFVRPAGGWTDGTEAIEVADPGNHDGDQFGYSAAISADGNFVLIGAVNVAPRGAAYVYWNHGQAWSALATPLSPQATLTTSDSASLGASVATSGGIYAAGAPSTNIDLHSGAGAAYVFFDDPTAPTSTITFPTATTYHPSTWSPDPCLYVTGGFCGTASDGAGGSGVAKVEWSLRQGSGNYYGGSSFDQAAETFHTATGTTSWSVGFPITNFPAGGSYTLHVRATDRAGNVEDPGPSVTFTIALASASTLTYTGDQFVLLPNSFTASAHLTCATSGLSGKTISFSLERNPITQVVGSYPLGSALTNASGVATLAGISTAGWQTGVYQITASFAGDDDCGPASDDATLTVASPGAAATGGGWYVLAGKGGTAFPRINFGFVVLAHSSGYDGQFLLIARGNGFAWRLKGTLSSFAKAGTCGRISASSAGGTGTLYGRSGSGSWVPTSDSPVTFTICFTDGDTKGGGTKSGDTFGALIEHIGGAGDPGPLPNSAPQLLKGGDVTIH